MTETVTVSGENITLDLLLWRRFGPDGQSLVEATLALNPGLAGLGPFIPAGRSVTLASLATSTPKVETVDLFS